MLTLGYHGKMCLKYVIIRDYLMAFGYRPKYQPESFSSRADNGGGLILRAITKTHVIICLSHIPFYYFNAFDVKIVSKTEEWRKFCVTSRHLFTSDVIK